MAKLAGLMVIDPMAQAAAWTSTQYITGPNCLLRMHVLDRGNPKGTLGEATLTRGEHANRNNHLSVRSTFVSQAFGR